MAKEPTKKPTKKSTEKEIEQSGERFVGTFDEFEYIGTEEEVKVVEIEE